jgi:hypothetical protein
MKTTSPLRKPLIGKFYTYRVSSSLIKGELMEMDFKVEGKEIKCTYTKLKTRSQDATVTFRNRKA